MTSRLGGKFAPAGRQQVEVRQHADTGLDGPADCLAQLSDHGAHHAHRHGAGLLVGARPAVEVEAAQVANAKAVPDIAIQERRQLLVALDQARQRALQARGDLGQLWSIGGLDRLFRGEFLGKFSFRNDDAHEDFPEED